LRKYTGFVTATILTFIACFIFVASADQQTSLSALQQALKQASQSFNGINTYTAKVILEERHGGKIKGKEIVRAACTKKPFRLYFHWLDGGLYAGLQVSHDRRRDGANQLQALESGVRGMVGVTTWSLDSRIIRTFYPHHFKLTQYDLGFLLQHVADVLEKATAKGKIKVADRGIATNIIPGRRVHVFAIELSENPSDGLLYRRSVLGFDTATHLPRLVETYNFNDKLHARYVVEELKINPSIDENIFTLKKN